MLQNLTQVLSAVRDCVWEPLTGLPRLLILMLVLIWMDRDRFASLVCAQTPVKISRVKITAVVPCSDELPSVGEEAFAWVGDPCLERRAAAWTGPKSTRVSRHQNNAPPKGSTRLLGQGQICCPKGSGTLRW